MSVNVLIITHGDIGQTLLTTIHATFEKLPLRSLAITVERDTDPDAMKQLIKTQIGFLDEGDGTLILTDMYGSTPANIAKGLLQDGATEVVAGLNLPMLTRIMNYPDLPLRELAQKAVSGGRDGVIDCQPEDQ